MKIQLLDVAERDLIEGFHFYERQSKGLGSYFLDSLFSDIESLQLYSGIHAKYFGFHRLLAKRFPFTIYYRVSENIVSVYAILDCRRNPAWIRKKLK